MQTEHPTGSLQKSLPHAHPEHHLRCVFLQENVNIKPLFQLGIIYFCQNIPSFDICSLTNAGMGF